MKKHLLPLLGGCLLLGWVLGGLTACNEKEAKGKDATPTAGASATAPAGARGGPGGGRGGRGGPGGARGPQAVLVTTTRVKQQDVPLLISDQIGTVEPVASVTIKARIGGQLEKVHFIEGQDVKQDDLLFTIDLRVLKTDLLQVQATLARDEAQLANARADAQRYQNLVGRGAVAASENEKIQAASNALEATVRADRATVEIAKLQLEYAEIRSPISGRTGSLKVDQGNLVKANDTDLVTINQISPIYITFSVDENWLSEIKRYMTQGTLTVLATLPGDDGPPETGTLTFLNNTVSAGTIQLRATFPNEDRRLWPGKFVNVTLNLATQKNGVLVPFEAIQNSQDGTFAFVVKPDMTVEARPVTIARYVNNNERRVGNDLVIASGLRGGEEVVTDGQMQLVPGSAIQIKPPAAAAKAAPPVIIAPANAGPANAGPANAGQATIKPATAAPPSPAASPAAVPPRSRGRKS